MKERKNLSTIKFLREREMEMRERSDIKSTETMGYRDQSAHRSTNQKSKENESGRSMVEMLGVLALMGVLAIGGVMGYRWAMTKYQANETFNELRRRVIVHSQQSITGSPLTQVELGDKTQLGYPITVTGIEGGFFELTLTGVENDLCREMVRTGWILPIQTRVNGIVSGTNEELCGETNELVFRFQTEMGGCKTDSDCLCGTCTNGTCVSTCGSGESCVKNFDDGQYVCCPSGKLVGNSCCEHPGSDGTCCDENSEYCCPPDKPLYGYIDHKCYSCDAGPIAVGYVNDNREEICNRCSNRIYINAVWMHQYCVLPCPDDKPLMDSTGNCYTCEDNSITVNVNGTQETCLKCSNRFLADPNGYQTPGGGWNHGCWRCDVAEPQSIWLGYHDTYDSCRNNCSERIQVNAYCAKPCADGLAMDNVGECRSCEDSEVMFNVAGVAGAANTDGGCNCPGVRFPGTLDAGGGSNSLATGCWRCDSEIQSIYFGTWGCPEYRGSIDYDTPCNQCPNRKTINSRYCAKYCTDGKIWDTKGQCHSCDEMDDFSVKGVPENKCACPGVRYLDGDICKKCPADISSLTPTQQAQCGG